MESPKIAVLVGSLRQESYNRKMAKASIALAPKTLSYEILEIFNLPLYNEDLDAAPPSGWMDFRNRLREFDGFLFFTPEYNRSVPAVLKNAIDVGSRPYGQNIWHGKPGGVVSVSLGSTGAFGANHHLRQSLVYVNVPTMLQPEAYIGNANRLFDSAGNLISDSTREYMTRFMEDFTHWVEQHLPRNIEAMERSLTKSPEVKEVEKLAYGHH